MYSARYYINTNGSKNEMVSLISTLKSLTINNTNLYIDTMHLSPPDAPLEVIITGASAQSTARELTEELLDNPLIESVNYTTNQERNILLASSLHPSFEPYEDLMNGLLNGQYQTAENIMVGLDSSDDLTVLEISNDILLSNAFSITTLNHQISAYTYNGAPSAYLSITPYQNRNIPDIQTFINDQLSDDLTVTYTGENALFLTLSNALIISGSIAVFGMFVLLFFQFKKLSDAFIILFTVPLSFTGSLIGMLIFQYDITVSSLIGMVSLLGVTVNIGILLIEEIEKELKLNTLKKAVIQGTSNRFRPIILTSATTILGLIPLYITGGDFFRPLAITFIFGMFFATIISIFVIPIMIYLSRIPKM
jgi:multidrug efflux pump subunit AcrB